MKNPNEKSFLGVSKTIEAMLSGHSPVNGVYLITELSATEEKQLRESMHLDFDSSNRTDK